MSNNDRLMQRIAGIEEFVRVAETLSFVRAAESLGQAPSAVSKSIRQLELRLGARLLHRTTRSVSLTEEGSMFYERASRWIAELDDMQSAVSGDPAELGGLVRIGMPTTFGRALFIPLLAAFLERYPKLSVEVRMNDHRVNLVAEGVDLALRIGDLSDSDLVVKSLGRAPMGTYVCPRCLERYGEPTSPEELLSHRLIALMPPTERSKPMFYVVGDQDIAIDTRHSVASFTNGDAMIDAAISGIGIAQTPAFYAKQAVEQGLLTQILKGKDAPGLAIQLVYPSRKQLPKRVRVLIEFLTHAMAHAWDEG
jgi:LysR family transcriptional regulator for bpeEF and oprC